MLVGPDCPLRLCYYFQNAGETALYMAIKGGHKAVAGRLVQLAEQATAAALLAEQAIADAQLAEQAIAAAQKILAEQARQLRREASAAQQVQEKQKVCCNHACCVHASVPENDTS